MGESKISRRDFLKSWWVLPAAAALAVKAENEISVLNRGVFREGNFLYQPIYEDHSIGIEIPLHPYANGLFLEYNAQHFMLTVRVMLVVKLKKKLSTLQMLMR